MSRDLPQNPLEKRAEELGLPTDPAAYQDGGLAVAATARNVPEAEIIATYLKSQDIPAWVNAPLTAMGYAEYLPPSVSVVVPHGRLADAQAALAERPEFTEPPAPPEDWESPSSAESKAESLLRTSRGTAFLSLFLAPLAPIFLFYALHLVVQARRAKQKFGSSPEIAKALRWTLYATISAALVTVCLGCVIFITIWYP